MMAFGAFTVAVLVAVFGTSQADVFNGIITPKGSTATVGDNFDLISHLKNGDFEKWVIRGSRARNTELDEIPDCHITSWTASDVEENLTPRYDVPDTIMESYTNQIASGKSNANVYFTTEVRKYNGEGVKIIESGSVNIGQESNTVDIENKTTEFTSLSINVIIYKFYAEGKNQPIGYFFQAYQGPNEIAITKIGAHDAAELDEGVKAFADPKISPPTTK